MRDRRKVVWIIAGILTVVCCVIGGYWLRSSDFFTQLKLRFMMSSLPIPAAENNRKLCQNGLNLLEETDVLRLGSSGDKAALTVKRSQGCISHNTFVYGDSLQAKQSFEHVLRHMIDLDAWRAVPLNDRADAYIFSSDFDWELNFPPYQHRGKSKLALILINQCDAMGIVNIFIAQEDEPLSPGIEMSERELTAYANQIYSRMHRLFCSN